MMKSFASEKDISGCAICAIMSEEGERFNGEIALHAIANMRERGNGLGAGFAAYGIYPEYKDCYALHLMYGTQAARETTEQLIRDRCLIHNDEPIPTRPVPAIGSGPILRRYFVSVEPEAAERGEAPTEDDIIVQLVMTINTSPNDAFVFSSGKNVGVFKGVGYPEDIAAFYQIDQYEGYIWTAHSRFPTNTPGWWGGAHPFGLLDWTVVHNGEISSYGINRRYLASFGYECTLWTDTEVLVYLFDLLVRKQGLSLDSACTVLAPPLWSQIERMPEEQREAARALRMVYGSALLNGPFAIVLGHSKGIIALNDRIKLRPLVAARKSDKLYVASEEAAIREVCPDPERLWHAEGGVPIFGRLKDATEAAGGRAKETEVAEVAG